MINESKQALGLLALQWPVGLDVRHETGWTGQVVVDHAEPIGWTDNGAHALLTRPVRGQSIPAVRVRRQVPGYGEVVGWFSPRVLSRSGRPPALPQAAQHRPGRGQK
ncbi:hypothetical protein [Actinocorallia longicatena]|uniref:Uncharacterized protein n=1 Tax=Actinocorallia longicatena TaxID=111803 RepID=A0ABP6QDW8_9ACTN